ncbi:PREDICTED: uncharacterized protein K02A2.6-like [Thamnophis sirtalis]|uniref:Uncharacterized protein K02A2.6-like n=1 Tax=Thamnophis sirtalis TaxID=35019 RepID=A0A6I9YVT6_9SAUR|nr:PREDICTED: uncharacterized protein K02A2.6-like [Thamnophis sirtalis]
MPGLWYIITTHGLPDVIVSDNGPQFTSTTFQEFLAEQGIRHAATAPYHPASNGRAERAVRSAKEALGRMDQGDWQERVAAYLLSQHSTPCPTTNKSPAELLMGRRLRTPLDRLHPLYAGDLPSNLGALPSHTFKLGDPVWARSFSGDPRWVPATITALTGPCSFRAGLADGTQWRRHLDQLRRRLPAEADGPSLSDTRSQRELPLMTFSPTDCLHSGNGGQADFSDRRASSGYSFPRSPYRDSESTSQPDCRGPLSDTPVATETPPWTNGHWARGPGPAPSLGAAPQTHRPATDTPPPAVSPSTKTAGELRRSGRERHRPTYLQDYVCPS